MTRQRILLTFGTRPEAIKMAPVVQECQRRSDEVELIVCLTGQHREMLDQVTKYFGIQADCDLELMQPDQTLSDLTARCLQGVHATIERFNPHCVVAQGDTTSVLATSLAAFYQGVPLVHIEAGLRTHNLQSPWPEEMNRRTASLLARLHCAPTQRSAQNLLQEGVATETVHVTGNTVIDALLWTVSKERQLDEHWRAKYSMLGSQRVVLITGHRRENFGSGLQQICQAIAGLADTFPEVIFLYPVHLNPRVQQPVHQLLGNLKNVHLIPPADYPEFVWLMDRSYIILTDSGGIQEEAPSLKKPVLVMRDTTERPEAVDAGAVELVGTSPTRIMERLSALLTDENTYSSFQITSNPYGDGQAAPRIVDLILQQTW